MLPRPPTSLHFTSLHLPLLAALAPGRTPRPTSESKVVSSWPPPQRGLLCPILHTRSKQGPGTCLLGPSPQPVYSPILWSSRLGNQNWSRTRGQGGAACLPSCPGQNMAFPFPGSAGDGRPGAGGRTDCGLPQGRIRGTALGGHLQGSLCWAAGLLGLRLPLRQPPTALPPTLCPSFSTLQSPGFFGLRRPWGLGSLQGVPVG